MQSEKVQGSKKSRKLRKKVFLYCNKKFIIIFFLFIIEVKRKRNKNAIFLLK